MQEIKQNHIIQDPSRFSWFASLTIFGLTFLSIGGFYGYQYIAAGHVETLQTEIAQLDTQIQGAATDREVLIANILSSTTIRPSIDLKLLVRSFRIAAASAGVRLSGFSVRDDIISSTLIVTQESVNIDPVETIIAMMRTENPNIGLSLEPISSLQGTASERTTGVSFRILSPKLTTNVTK